MTKKLIISIVAVLLISMTFAMTACGEVDTSKKEYWFTDCSTNFIAYSDEANNLSEAGTYWYFTAKNDMNISLNISTNVDLFTSTAYLYVNDVQVQSEVNTDVYQFVYKLNLKKGDVIKIHAFWVYSIYTNDEGFKLTLFTITKDGTTYAIDEYCEFTN